MVWVSKISPSALYCMVKKEGKDKQMALNISNKPDEQIKVEVQQVVKQVTETVKKTTTFAGMKVDVDSIKSVGNEFKSTTDKDWNEMDKWFINHLYFSMKTDGGLNFVAAKEPTQHKLIILPMKTTGVTSLNQESPNLLPDEFKKKIEEFCNIDDWFSITTLEKFKELRDKFPLVFLRYAEAVGEYGEMYRTHIEKENGQEEEHITFRNLKTRLLKARYSN